MRTYDFKMYGWDVAVDYVTATMYPQEDDRDLVKAKVLTVAVIDKWCPVEKARPMRLMGYQGAGNGTVFAGQGVNGYMVRCSGRPSGEFVQALGAGVWRASRFDVALDVRLGYDCDVVIRDMFEAACMYRDQQTKGFRRKIRLVDTAGEGDTLYVGSRVSSVFLRVYNKAKESKSPQYAGVMRLEAQFNGVAAADVLAGWERSAYKVGALLATVLRVLYMVGLSVSVSGGAGEYLRWHVVPPTPDDLSQVEWLRKQVGPTARRLEEVYGTGFVLGILGLIDEGD